MTDQMIHAATTAMRDIIRYPTPNSYTVDKTGYYYKGEYVSLDWVRTWKPVIKIIPELYYHADSARFRIIFA